jgi:Na+/H+ antiporter NhaD/arsenite permease-like protein
MPIEYLIFVLTLTGVAFFHRRAFSVALVGLAATLVFKILSGGFADGAGLEGLAHHFAHEWVTLANLTLLLTGFAMLASHFEHSNLPHAIPRYLPLGWLGGLCLLGLVFVLSGILDNIAAAVIGGVIARHVYRGKVGVGFVASIVAAANAGGAGSVVGDTTTTMMWLDGVSPLVLLKAYAPSLAAFAVFGVIGALKQHRHAPIERHDGPPLSIDWARLAIVLIILTTIIIVNVGTNAYAPDLAEVAPVLGMAIWMALLLCLILRPPEWAAMLPALKSAVFLVALVALASLMPVESLPPPSHLTTLGLGFLSAVFDNIPLTALALQQGGYDWAMLAFSVGFGGSMVWFGSSAGVAITGQFPEGRSFLGWIAKGWHIVVAYIVGFACAVALSGWTLGA